MFLSNLLRRKISVTSHPEHDPWYIKMLLIILESVSVVLIIFFLVKLFFFQSCIVVGRSMEPTLQENDEVYADIVSYKYTSPKRGDIVVLVPPNEPNKKLVKRIIGLPGERLEIKGDGQVIIYNSQFQNGIALREDYLKDKISTIGFSVETLGPDDFFVMGDNRKNSNDSRGNLHNVDGQPLSSWSLPKRNILGRVVLRTLPKSQITWFQRPKYNF
jgi:signal peptidase I